MLWVLLIPLAVYGQTLPTPGGVRITSSVRSVIVYRNRARVHQSGLATGLPVGEPVIVVLENLPQFDPDSLSVSASRRPSVDLVSVQQRVESVVNHTAEARAKNLQQQLDEVDRELSARNAELRMLQTYEKIVADPKNNGATLSELLDWYLGRRKSISSAQKQLTDQRQTLMNEINGCRQSLQTSWLAEVKVVLREEGPLNLTIAYLVNDACWEPVYDLRASTKEAQAELVGRARITYNGELPWEDVKLELSTAEPDLGRPPILTPWRLQFGASHAAPPMMAKMRSRSGEVPLQNVEATAKQQATSQVFVIPGVHTIYQGVSANIPLLSVAAPCYFRYEAIPKLSPHAFLKAKMTNPTNLTLLGGAMAVYLDGNFVTTSRLDTVGPAQEFWTSLGTDGGMSLDHRFIKKQAAEESSLFSSERHKVQYEYRIKVYNMKGGRHEVVVWDQLPLPEDKDIIVTMVSPMKGRASQWERNEFDYLEWQFDLEPGEEVVIDLWFSVEYPKGKRLEGL